MIVDSVGDEKTVRVFGRDVPQSMFVIRLFYFFYFASFGSLFPMLGIYFKQLGMTAGQAGLLLGCRPLVEFIAVRFWGTFAERFRKALLRTIVDLSSYDSEDDRVIGKAPEFITSDKVCNYREHSHGVLVSPPHSTRVYREPAVEQSFMLLLLLVALGELFSSPAIALADGYTLNVLADRPKEFGKTRLFGSIGWAAAMLVMGIGLDFSDTFRNHPCPTRNTTERNYTLCFVACTIFDLAAMGIATQFKFSSTQEQHRPDAVGGLVMDTRMEEGERAEMAAGVERRFSVDPAIAQKARGKQLHAAAPSGEEASSFVSADGGRPPASIVSLQVPWKAALRSMMNVHFSLYLSSVVVVGIGAGNVFAFLFWTLQDLGGSPILFGLCSLVNHGAEIVAYFYTFQVINKYGYIKTMYACLGANVIRFLLIAWISNPWLILPLQALQGATLSVVWASATSYVSLVSPDHLKPHTQYILSLLYNGIGKGIGPMLGGMFITSSGSRVLFATIALLNLIALGANFAANRVLKFEGIKYSNQFVDEDDIVGAPQGIPMAPQDATKITDVFNAQTTNANYGTIEESNPQDEAYDRYVSTNPFR